MTTKDKEILELADVFGVACQIQCQECPVYARFKDDLELEGAGPFLIIEDGKYVDCVDYIRATAVYDAGYRKQSEVAREIFEEIEKKVKASITIHLEEINKEHIIDTPLYDRHSGIIFALQRIDDFIAELKKKYTEGGE